MRTIFLYFQTWSAAFMTSYPGFTRRLHKFGETFSTFHPSFDVFRTEQRLIVVVLGRKCLNCG